MLVTCPTMDPNAGGALTLVTEVDCFVKSTVQDSYTALMGQGSPFSQALTIALTLYVAVIGYRMIFGRTSLTLGAFAPKALLMGLVLALSSNWAAYQTVVFDLLTDGPQEIAMMLGSHGGSAQSVTARVDAVSNKITDISADWSAATTPQAPDPAVTDAIPKPVLGESPGPNLLLFSAMLLVLASAGVLAVAKILLGLLLAIGPAFIALALFDLTRGLAFGWLRVCVLLALVPLLTLMTSVGALAMIEPMVINLAVQAAADEFSLRSALALFIIVLVMAAVCFQLFRIALAITGNWTFWRSPEPQATRAGDRVLAPQLPTAARENSTINPRIDVLINALERSNLTRETAQTTVRRDLTAPQMMQSSEGRTPLRETSLSRSRITDARSRTRHAVLRPVRSAT
jgi:type IV secretion system protein VirB6